MNAAAESGRVLPPTVRQVQEAVAEAFSVPLASLVGPSHARRFCYARFAAMWLARELTYKSMPVIGREFGRDHTTVMHGCKRAEALMGSDAGFAEHVRSARRRLEKISIPKGSAGMLLLWRYFADVTTRRLEREAARG